VHRSQYQPLQCSPQPYRWSTVLPAWESHRHLRDARRSCHSRLQWRRCPRAPDARSRCHGRDCERVTAPWFDRMLYRRDATPKRPFGSRRGRAKAKRKRSGSLRLGHPTRRDPHRAGRRCRANGRHGNTPRPGLRTGGMPSPAPSTQPPQGLWSSGAPTGPSARGVRPRDACNTGRCGRGCEPGRCGGFSRPDRP